MKKILSLCLILISCLAVAGTGESLPQLKFSPDGQFKILQLTDLHFVSTAPEQTAKTFARMDFIVNSEKPDFIAVTGDVIFARPAREMLQSIVDRLDSYKIPFCIVFGNHDAEQEMTRAEMSAIISSAKYSLNTLNEAGELADLRLLVKGSEPGSRDLLNIFMLDSHDYSHNPDVDGYAWFTFDQIKWLRSECEAATASSGGQHVPSVAFFHIPVPEFYDAWVLAQEKQHNSVIGLRGEYGGHPKINSGMFSSMLETGNVMGIFCGHDHDSDYIISYHGIALVYGRFSGDDTVYNHLAHGSRIITFDQKALLDGKRTFHTWIHEDDDRIEYNVRFEDGVLTRIW